MKYALVGFVLMLFSCTHHQHRELDAQSILVQIDEPNRIRFSGRGAGAGVMLAGSMGPMGIAIGVAIDEGIGKEIHQSALASGFDLEGMLVSHLRAAWNNASINALADAAYIVRVHRYGFRGAGDEVNVELDISLVCGGDAERRIRYPVDVDDASTPEGRGAVTRTSVPFDKVKTDGRLVIAAFSSAVEEVISRCINLKTAVE